ncbi:MAG: transglutaminase-like domain-containing protein [Gordonibacter sp.]|nr:transglutaminase-like domain-containing protein [Gordonibacter sp.]
MREGNTLSLAYQYGKKAHQSQKNHCLTTFLHAGRTAISLLASLAIIFTLTSCNSSSNIFTPNDSNETSGPTFVRPDLKLSPFNSSIATERNGVLIDVSQVEQGYVSVSAISQNRLKFQVSKGDYEYNYDLPNDGTAISCPLSVGDGIYSFTVWENTSGNRYAELASVPDCHVTLIDEFQPFIRPSIYCNYDAQSASTQLANSLCENVQNQGDALHNIYSWIVDNISYDEEKARTLANATGYIPSPDETLSSKRGICFDYASLAAAMLRSQGIPCKIVTGNVSPDNIYHAWNMVYIDGTWISASIDIEQNTWARIDTTFAAGSGSNYVGDGTNYTEQYTY